MDEQKVDCNRATVNQHCHIHDQIEHEFGLDGWEEPEEGDDQYQIIGQETQQLSFGIIPNGTVQSIQKVKRVTEKDTAKDDG